MSSTQLKLAPISEPQSLKVRAYEALRAAIMELNIYAPDAELRLDERALSADFGVSRTPLREALAQLDQEGLVRIVPRRGIYIVRRTKAEIVEMITVWAALESMAARLATQVASDAELKSLRPLVDTFSSDAIAQKMGEYSDANIRFHQAIIRLGECRLIEAMTENLFIHARAIRAASIRQENRTERSMAEHRAIIAALEAGDPDLAERLVRDHALGLADHVRRHGSFP